jgi:putative ABC transport system permease protein
MISKENIFYILRNLIHKKGRSFLTIFSILVGIATIFVFISFGMGLYSYTKELSTSSSANKLLITAKGAEGSFSNEDFKLTENDLETIKKTSGVYDVTGIYFDAVEIKKGNEKKYVFMIAYNPLKSSMVLETFGIGVEKGRELKKDDQKKVLLGNNYLIDGKIFSNGLEVNDNLEINGKNFRVVGFLEPIGNPQDDSQIYVPNEFFKELFPEKDTYNELIAEVDTTRIDNVVDDITRNLRKERGLDKGKEDFFVQSFSDMIESFSQVLKVIVGFIILIALISVLVSAINTANTMITSVLERYKEIGILKAIGAKNSEIFKIFLFESAFLGMIAGILGVLVGFGITSFADNLLNNLGWGFLSPYYSLELFSGCILFAIFTGAISGVIPAVKASRINTVNALRYE